MNYGNALLENTVIFRHNVFINIIRREGIRRPTADTATFRILPTTQIYSPSSQFAERAKELLSNIQEKNTNPGAWFVHWPVRGLYTPHFTSGTILLPRKALPTVQGVLPHSHIIVVVVVVPGNKNER